MEVGSSDELDHVEHLSDSQIKGPNLWDFMAKKNIEIQIVYQRLRGHSAFTSLKLYYPLSP